MALIRWWKKLDFIRNRRFLRSTSSPEKMEVAFQFKYRNFKELLDSNSELLNIIANIESKLEGHEVFGMAFVQRQAVLAVFHALRMATRLNQLSRGGHSSLLERVEAINRCIQEELERHPDVPVADYIVPLTRVTRDSVDWVGHKSANLGEVLNRLQMPVPRGFAVTIKAYYALLEANDLSDEIETRKTEINPGDLISIQRVSEEIQGLIMGAEVPEGLANEMIAAHRDLGGNGAPPPRLAMRSSALQEDSEDLSFAGQYRSILNVPPEKLNHAYKSIVASLYTPHAISYRLSRGIRDDDLAMGVTCLEMITSVASGVMYTRHPTGGGPDRDETILITAVWGLGPYAVDGTVSPDTYVVAKDEGLHVLEIKPALKPIRLLAGSSGELSPGEVPASQREKPCLNEDHIQALARYAVALENHYGTAQDIEWALDPAGNLYILQARPLKVQRMETETLVPPLHGYRLLVAGGAAACGGVGSGPAFHVSTEADLAKFPKGGVLVARHSSPQFVAVMSKAQAIVTDFGSVTGHMASLAREFGVPALLDAQKATTLIPPGTEVTVDAYSCRVYEGRVPELIALQKRQESLMKDTPVYQMLRRIADRIVPLNLLDPKGRDFTPRGCRTLHDVMRFVHECSYSYMFQISDAVSEEGGSALKLDSSVALDLYIIDVGGGLKHVRIDKKKVPAEAIESVPFLALLRGLGDPVFKELGPRPIHLNGFMAVMRQQLLSPPLPERFGERSYAIIADHYMNFSSRVGYHYCVVDAYCGQSVNKNYITFSFKGGAADDTRRNRRARAIAEILQNQDFNVETVKDRVDGRCQKHERPRMEEKLEMVGRLLQFTRQMDMLMDNEASVANVVRCFQERDYAMCFRSDPGNLNDVASP